MISNERIHKKRLYIDFHVIQTVPPSCVNRDDTGSPKTAFYGGTIRARISSQAWKRSIREMFKSDIFENDKLGNRTKRVVDLVAKEIQKIDSSFTLESAEKKAQEVLKDAGVSLKEKNTDALFFMSELQARSLAEISLENYDKNDAKKALKDNPSIDMALFGRMVASDPSLNYDAAAQVAHSISTHTVHNEFDYFTAVDDCAPEDNAGAGHIGTTEFNSSTLYRYATVNVAELASNLGIETATKAVCGFAKAFILSMPTGKQNSFANRTVPNMVYVTIRDDQPVNLIGAFEKPVFAADSGYIEKSEKSLADYSNKVYDTFVHPPVKEFWIGDCPVDAVTSISLQDMLNQLEQFILEKLSE